jgi:hypothetical protein
MRKRILFCVLFSGAFCLTHTSFAQEQKQSDPQANSEYDMPNLTPDISSDNMPNTEFLKSYGSDPDTGKPHYYMDTESGLYFDFDEKKVRNYKNGEVYTFEEVKKLLQQKDSKGAKPKSKII